MSLWNEPKKTAHSPVGREFCPEKKCPAQTFFHFFEKKFCASATVLVYRIYFLKKSAQRHSLARRMKLFARKMNLSPKQAPKRRCKRHKPRQTAQEPLAGKTRNAPLRAVPSTKSRVCPALWVRKKQGVPSRANKNAGGIQIRVHHATQRN